jgi:curved DNA-binding protein CbpA
MKIPDYYEFLQISPNAEPATIHRVYRYLASRFHPDIPETGDAEKFVLLKEAYEVLSDPERRADYDATYKKEAPQPVPLSTSIDFLDNIEGEMNRRLAVLGLLYLKRRTNPYAPEVSLNEVETRMGFPRDYLHFTTWYLRNKNYITQADNSDFTLTVQGVDFVESNRAEIPVLNRLLTTGSGPSSPDEVMASKALNPSRTPLIVPGGKGASERRGAIGDGEG